MMEHLSILTGIENPTKKLIKTYYSEKIPKSTSINVIADDVFNIVDGYSIKIIENKTKLGSRYIIEMKICNDLIIRYLNLKELYIPSRYAVPKRTRLGKADSIVGIEYCTRVRSNYPVRINNATFYKHDPSKFLFDDYLPKMTLPTYYFVLNNQFEAF